MNFFGFIGRPKETTTPPPSLQPVNLPHENPPTFVYTQRREPHVGISYKAAPDSQFQEMLPENIPWQEAPDPIRQSDFWNWNNKIHPDAQMRITSHLAIGVKESVMQDEYQVGKLLGYIRPGRQQYAGAQLPSVYRVNIEPAVSNSYGSLYTMRGMSMPGTIALASGMSYNAEGFSDGYPY